MRSRSDGTGDHEPELDGLRRLVAKHGSPRLQRAFDQLVEQRDRAVGEASAQSQRVASARVVIEQGAHATSNASELLREVAQNLEAAGERLSDGSDQPPPLN